MSDKGLRFRPMLIGEVAKVAGDPRETIRTRIKQGVFSDSLFKFRPAQGWKRYTDFETILVSVHARVKRLTGDDEFAAWALLLAGKALMDEWIEHDGVPYFQQATFDKDRYLIFWRPERGEAHAELAQTSEDLQAAVDGRFAESFGDAPAFLVVNLRAILGQTLLAMYDVQIDMAGGE